MKKVILGATGSIGSSLAKKLVESGEQLHLVGRDETSLSELANELNSTFTTCDVLEDNFSEKIVNDLKDEQVRPYFAQSKSALQVNDHKHRI